MGEEQLFGLSRFRLFYKDVGLVEGFGLEELKLPKQILHALRVSDGDEFHLQVCAVKLRLIYRLKTTPPESFFKEKIISKTRFRHSSSSGAMDGQQSPISKKPLIPVSSTVSPRGDASK